MRLHSTFSVIGVGTLLLHLSSCAQNEVEEEAFVSWPTEVPEEAIDFKRDVRPILIINCFECHNGKTAAENGNLNLESRQLALTTGNRSPVIVPGQLEKSLFLQVLDLDIAHPVSMPPTPDKIWGVRKEILRRWIAEGAEWPESVKLVHPREL